MLKAKIAITLALLIAILPVTGGWLQARPQLQSGLGVDLYFVEIRYRLHYGADIMDWCAAGTARVDLRPSCGTFTMTD